MQEVILKGLSLNVSLWGWTSETSVLSKNFISGLHSDARKSLRGTRLMHIGWFGVMSVTMSLPHHNHLNCIPTYVM